MRTRHRPTLEDLRRAVEYLPRHTRIAMLQGLEDNEIIVGAYATGDGICPMLAAHRAGGRTAAISFARAWDGFAFRDARSARARRATERELLILRAHLQASLLDEDAAATVPPRRRTTRPGDPDRSRELDSRPGWAWTRIFRGYDDYARMLAHLDDVRERAERTVV